MHSLEGLEHLVAERLAEARMHAARHRLASLARPAERSARVTLGRQLVRLGHWLARDGRALVPGGARR